MDSLRGMEIFVAVADAESFSRGAASLQISPAQASQQIRRIEKRLGVRLVDRSTRHLRLTEEGKTFYSSSREIMRAVQEAELRVAELGATPQGRLRVEAPGVLVDNLILPTLGSFRQSYPDISLEFIHTDHIFGGTHPECEVIVRLGPFSDTSLVAHTLGSVRMGTFASPEYLAKQGEPSSPADLLQHSCINFVDPISGAVHPWTFTKGDEEFSFVPEAGIAFNQGVSRLAAALAGLGVYRGLRLGLSDYLRDGKLCDFLTDWDVEGPPLVIAYAGERILSQRARCFVDHIRAFCRGSAFY